MLRKLILPFAGFVFMLTAVTFGQGTVQGTVIEARTGDTLPGVNVVVQGTNIGASTNVDGEFVINNVEPGTYTLQAKFVGFATQSEEITVSSGETTTVNFELRQSSVNLDEVVVTGAGGPVEKRKLGNSIGSIDSEDLETSPINNFSDVIQGREPGLVGLPSGGATGEGSRIRIRGSASLSQSNEPLIYIDGVRADNAGGFGGLVGNDGGSPSRLDDINPDMIERVEVLKGAAAATLYGTEASNGVIQIFTKQGAVLDQPQFDFNISNAAITYPRDIIEPNTGYPMNQSQADGMNTVYGTDLVPYELHQEDFIEEMFEVGHRQTYSASVRGGNPGITYNVSARWSNEDGPYAADQWPGLPEDTDARITDTNKKVQFNSNMNIYPSDKLVFQISTGYTDTKHSTWPLNNNTESPTSLVMLSKMQRALPNDYSGSGVFATVAEATQLTFDQSVQHFNGSFNANYTPLEFLTLDATFGVDFVNQFSEFTRPFGWNIDGFAQTNVFGERNYSDRNNMEITGDFKGTMNNTLSPKFESTFIVGAQAFISSESITSGEAIGFPGPGITVANAADQQTLDEVVVENVNAGIFAQEQIGFNDYLFGTVGARLDANSAFGSDFSFVVYPKASLSFIPTDAPFWEVSDDGFINSLQIRTAIGQSGLQPGAFDALTTYSSFSSTSGAGVAPQNLGNPELKPEISTEWELGTEMSLLGGRMGFEATYWNRQVTDALVARQFPVSGGFINTQLDNVGEVSGQGIEVSLQGTPVSTQDWQVDLFANTAYLYEKVESLGGAPPIKVGGSYTRHRNFIIEGYAPGTHFGAKLMDVPEGSLPVDLNGDGQPDTEQELLTILGNKSAQTSGTAADLPASTSSVLLVDEDGDGDLYDHFLGKPFPDFSGSFGGGVNYKQFSMNFMFEYQFGNYYVNNLGKAFRSANPAIGRNTPATARLDRDYATGGVDENYNPQNSGEVRLDALKDWIGNYLGLAPFQGLNFVEKADWLRFRELSLTYNVPSETLSGLGIRKLSVTGAARNLALWTAFNGDPEVNEVGRGAGTGLDQNFLVGVSTLGLPIPRSYVLTVNLGF